MWRAILVDDEEYVRAELAALFPWGKHRFNLIGEAESALMAIKLIEETEPDLLITDIRMPEMDGLALISQLKQAFPQLVVAVVSAYNDFPYVREALRLGAVDYLIKAEATKETAGFFLERIGGILEHNSSALHQQKELTNNVSQYHLLATESFWRDILTKASNEAETKLRSRQLNIDWDKNSRFGLIFIHIANYQAGVDENKTKCSKIIEEKIKVYCDYGWAWNLIDFGRGDFTILVGPIGKIPSSEILLNLAEIAGKLALNTDLIIITNFSPELCSFNELPDKFREVREINGFRLTDNYSQVSLTIRKALDYIQGNFCRDISLEEVAAYAGVSKSYLSRVFPEYTGEHFSAYLQRIRIERAKELLRLTNDHIYEIASKVGFWSSRYFSKVFHEIVGVTPAEYRRFPVRDNCGVSLISNKGEE